MSMSLRDQLLAAGLGSKKQAKQITHQERQQQHYQAKQRVVPPTNEQKLAVQAAQAAKAARDQELNRQQQEKVAKKARRAEVMQLIEQHREPKIDPKAESDDFFNFIDRQRVRRVAVNPQLRERIARGELRFVRYKGHYELVPAAIAERIHERDDQAVVTIAAEPEKTVDQDDPYKDFVVPDDLRW
ncbi:MAG: DUF2058 domain-containing protein [Steroidobacteraceae bacterium]